MISGFLAIVSGLLGYRGQAKKHDKEIIASIAIAGTVAPLAFVLFGLGFGIGSTIAGECDSRSCSPSTNHCNKIGCSDVGIGTQDCFGWCKNDYTYFCDDMPPYFTALAVIYVMVFLASLPSAALGCGAACACPTTFFGEASEDEKALGAIIGRPLS